MDDAFGKDNKLTGLHFSIEHFRWVVVEFQLEIHFVKTIRTTELNRSDPFMSTRNKLKASIFEVYGGQRDPNGQLEQFVSIRRNQRGLKIILQHVSTCLMPLNFAATWRLEE